MDFLVGLITTLNISHSLSWQLCFLIILASRDLVKKYRPLVMPFED